jgi:hypothetical protein
MPETPRRGRLVLLIRACGVDYELSADIPFAAGLAHAADRDSLIRINNRRKTKPA